MRAAATASSRLEPRSTRQGAAARRRPRPGGSDCRPWWAQVVEQRGEGPADRVVETPVADTKTRPTPLTASATQRRIEHTFEHRLRSGGDMQAHDIQDWTHALTEYAGPQTDTERIDTLRRLEVLKCAAEALQAEVTAAFDASQRADQAAAGIPADAKAAASPGRSPSPAASHPTAPNATSGSRTSWPPSCRTPGPRSGPVGSPNGPPPSSRGRPRACRWRTGGPWTPSSPPTPTGSKPWASGSSKPQPRSSPTSSTPPRSSNAAAEPKKTAGSPCGPHPT